MGLCVVLLVGMTIVILSIDSIAQNQINKALQRHFTKGGNLEAIDIRFIDGRVGLNGLTINPPEGFGKDPIFQLNQFEAVVAPGSLFNEEIVVEQLNVKEMSLTLVRDEQGDLNLQKLIVPRDTNTEAAQTGGIQDEKPVSIPAVRINTVRFETITVHLIDQQRDKQLFARMQLDLRVDDLFLKDLLGGKSVVKKAEIMLSDIRLDQIQALDESDKWQAGLKQLSVKTKGVTVADIAKGAVSLDSFTLDLQGLTVDQPAGFGPDKFASLERLAITTGKLDLRTPAYAIDEILMIRPFVSVHVQKDSQTNVQKLLHALIEDRQATTAEHDAPVQKEDISASQEALPVIRITEIKMEDGAFNLRDESLTDKALAFPLKNIHFETTRLQLFEKNSDLDPTPVSVSFELEQPGELPTAYFGGLAAVGPIGAGKPLVNSQVRLVGLKLETFGDLIPPGTDVTLGASGFDAEISLILDTHSVHVDGSGTSDKNVQYEGIKVRGPRDAPEVKMGVLLAGAYSRVADGMVNLGLKGLGAGVDIVEGGLGVAKAVGKGALEVGKNIGESALEVGTGLVTLDQQKLEKGIKGTTIDTARLTSDTVKDSGTAASDSLGQSASELKGDNQKQKWDDGIPERFQVAMQEAKGDLAKMSFPPSLD